MIPFRSIRTTLRSAALAALSGVLLSCASTTQLTAINEVTKPGRGGVFVTLPMTALDVTVPLTRKHWKKGRFHDSAEALFGVAPPSGESSTSFSLGVPTITPVGIPDQDKRFYAEITGGGGNDSSMTFQFDNQGIMTSAVVEAENKTIDYVVSTVEAVAKIAGSAAKFASQKAVTDAANQNRKQTPEEIAFEHARKMADVVKDVVTQPSGGSADLVTFEARVKKAEEMLTAALAPFYGTTTVETWTMQYRIVPTTLTGSAISLFTYDYGQGITEFHMAYRNKLQSALLAKNNSSANAGKKSTFSLSIEASEAVTSGELAKTLGGQKKRGLHYNIPATGTVIARAGGTRLATTQVAFGQFGTVGFLPVSTGSRKLRQEVTLDGSSGRLLKVQYVSTAFDPQLINRTGNAVAGVLDAYDPKLKAERQRDKAKAEYETLDYEKKAAALRNPPPPAD